MKKELDWAWAAGLFEGEGWIRFPEPGSSRGMALASTDQDVVYKFYSVVEKRGNVYERGAAKRRNPRHKLAWEWKTGRYEDIKYILERFVPYLGERRKINAVAMLNMPLTYGKTKFCRKCGKEKTLIDSGGYKRCESCTRNRYKEWKRRKNLEETSRRK